MEKTISMQIDLNFPLSFFNIIKGSERNVTLGIALSFELSNSIEITEWLKLKMKKCETNNDTILNFKFFLFSRFSSKITSFKYQLLLVNANNKDKNKVTTIMGSKQYCYISEHIKTQASGINFFTHSIYSAKMYYKKKMISLIILPI